MSSINYNHFTMKQKEKSFQFFSPTWTEITENTDSSLKTKRFSKISYFQIIALQFLSLIDKNQLGTKWFKYSLVWLSLSCVRDFYAFFSHTHLVISTFTSNWFVSIWMHFHLLLMLMTIVIDTEYLLLSKFGTNHQNIYKTNLFANQRLKKLK